MTVSNAPWSNFSQADYSVQQFRAACLIDLNTGPSSDATKGNCKLPVREPSGALNRNAVHAAAARLAGAGGGVMAPPAAKKAAARKLLSLYSQIGDPAPDSIKRMAG